MNDLRERMAAQLRKFDPITFFELTRGHGHGGRLDIRYQQHGEDWIELALPWREDLVGVPESGLLASGAIVSLIDMAAGLAVWTKLGVFKPMATLDLRIDYLRPAAARETLFARCRCVRTTRSVAFVSGFAHVGEPDDPVANAALTFMST